MFTNNTIIRVRYSETDRMGYSYYGNYATYFEVARVEALRSLGINYKTLEDEGILLPVVEYSIRFIKPAFYDDELLIRTIIPTLPTVRARFEYETLRGEQLLNKAWTELVFFDKISEKPVRCPLHIEKLLSPFFPT